MAVKHIEPNIFKENQYIQKIIKDCETVGKCAGSIIDGIKHTYKNDSKIGEWMEACRMYLNPNNQSNENDFAEMDNGEIIDFCFTSENFESIPKFINSVWESSCIFLNAFITITTHSSQKDGFGDINNIKNTIFGSGNKELNSFDKILETCKGITSLVDFAKEEKYKDYLAETDTLTESKEGIEQMRTCLDICDYMNLGFTANDDKGIQEPWTCVSEGSELENNSDSQFFGKVYANPETEELIIAFCGTNSLDDFATDDVQMIKGEVPEQYKDALKLYNSYANDENFKDYKITITGHSLGGALAQLVSSTEGVEADKTITFNAFGAYNIFNNGKNEYNFVENPDESKMFNYITEGDIVSNTGRHLGQTTLIESIGNDLLNNHMLQSIHYYLEQKSDKIC